MLSPLKSQQARLIGLAGPLRGRRLWFATYNHGSERRCSLRRGKEERAPTGEHSPHPMGLRLILSRLASAQTRTVATRALAMLCVTGYVLTLLVLFATGGTLGQWFFVLLVWVLFVYAPLRILLEAAQTLAPALRRRLFGQAAGDPRRYASRSSVEVMVDGLFDRNVVMPRIAAPVQGIKAREGATAVLVRADQAGGGLRGAVADCLASLDRWVAEASARASEGRTNIQARWSEVRALAALAAMTRVLTAVDEDRSGLGERTAQSVTFLDACLDYCDDLALEVDAPAWDASSLHLIISEARAAGIRNTWRAFCETPSPALEARGAFVDTLLNAPVSSPPTRSTAS